MNPNQVNNFFGIKVSKPGINVNDASDNQLVYKNNYDTTTYYDNNNSRIAEGLLPDGNYGMWVSKPGFDVTDPNAAINNNLIFNSNQDIFKIVDIITLSLTLILSGSAQTVNTQSAHGLNFLPAYQAFITADPSWNQFFGVQTNNGPNPFIVPAIVGGAEIISVLFCSVTVDETNVYFQATTTLTGSGTQNYSARVYLLQETFAAS